MSALDALYVARRAWEATQPQLTIDGWGDMLDELDGGDLRAGVASVEPAPDAPSLPLGRGGLHQTTTEQGANLSQRSRALLQKGV